ncbi:MAG: hypothetical protein HZB65_01390 [Candidatus Aenigmarchaeota archaeon]|nr:hypothetical protein [Candidatus Aenigmarchaeota archaeon]
MSCNGNNNMSYTFLYKNKTTFEESHFNKTKLIKMKNHPWDNAYVIIAGLVLLAVILVAPFIITGNITDSTRISHDIAKSLPKSLQGDFAIITGNYYEPGSGIRGFITGSDDSYIIALGNTIIAKEQVRINEFAGTYKISSSRFLSEKDFNSVKDIIMIGKEDSLDPILDSAKSIRNNPDDESIVILSEEKRQLTILGGSSDALIYTINLLKTLECKDFASLVVITEIGAGCRLYTAPAENDISPLSGSGYSGGVEIINNTENKSSNTTSDKTDIILPEEPLKTENKTVYQEPQNKDTGKLSPIVSLPAAMAAQPDYILFIAVIVIIAALLISVAIYRRRKKSIYTK